MRQIKVLQLICPVGFYGAERWILALANNLKIANVRCDLAVTKEDDNQNLEIVDKFPAKCGQAFELNMKGRFDPAVIKQLCELVQQREIDVIHTHGYKSDILGLIAAKKTGIKCISTPHGFGNNIGLKLKLFVKIGCFCLRYFDRVAPLSSQLYKDVLAMKIPEYKLAYIQNGVDVSELSSYVRQRKQCNSENPSLHIGFVGQLIPRKGIADLLKIFDKLWQEDKGLQLSLLGDGVQREELESMAKSLSSATNIHFLGFRLDRLEIMQKFDLFAMTSYLEGIPRCLMEALAMQLPVAAYDIPGIDQLVRHKQSGLLADVGDWTQLSSYWQKLLYDQDYAYQLAVSGREYVEENFSASRMAIEYTNLYAEVLSSADTNK